MTGAHDAPQRPSPKATDADKAHFRTLVPEDERVTVRPMFGAVAAFVNGQMFMGLFASELFVRLNDEDQEIVSSAGGGPLEPMPGRPMRGYVTIPHWQSDEENVRRWGGTALEFALTLPPKEKR